MSVDMTRDEALIRTQLIKAFSKAAAYQTQIDKLSASLNTISIREKINSISISVLEGDPTSNYYEHVGRVFFKDRAPEIKNQLLSSREKGVVEYEKLSKLKQQFDMKLDETNKNLKDIQVVLDKF